MIHEGRRPRRLPFLFQLAACLLVVPSSQLIAQGDNCDLDGYTPPCSDCDLNGVRDVCETDLPDGLIGQYFRSNGSERFDERLLIQVDAQVDFNWGGSSPGFGLPTDNFAVIWTGTIEVPQSGLQEIATYSDDGARLWVGGQLVVDAWEDQSGTRNIGLYDFTAGERVPIRMEYYENGGEATARLEWRLFGEVDFSAVPQSALRPDTDIDGDGFPDACYADCNDNGVNDQVEIRDGLVDDCNGNCSPDECDEYPKDIAGYWRFEGEYEGVAVDSGPFGLVGTTGDAIRQLDVDRRLIPQTGETNTTSIAMQDDTVSVPDPGGLLRFPDESFTIEAWIRIDVLSTNSDDNGQRQYILQKKPLASFDSELGYAFMAQGGNIAQVSQYNFGKQSGFSGRELVLRFGLGDGGGSSSSWSVTSSLEINDNDWHYVSVAWDEEAAETRFVLDDRIETVTCYDFDRAIGSGALRIGGHSNSSGLINQVLKGSIDEVRISRGFKRFPRLLHQFGAIDCNGNGQLDRCDILDGTSSDVDENFVPDECEDCNNNELPDEYEVELGLAPDCNGNLLPDECDLVGNDCDQNGIPDDCQVLEEDCNFNGVVDSCDIASGTVEDCQGDDIPDDCQLNEIVTYEYTDGFPEYGVRPDSGTHYTWMNGYRVVDGANKLVAMEISYVYIARNTPATIYVWADPTGDFDPTDAVPIAALSSVVDMPDLTEGWRRQLVTFPEPIDLGPDGSVYFVGTSLRFSIPDDFPAAYDISPPTYDGRSWHISTEGPLDPADVSANSTEFGPIDQIIFSGNWDIQAITLKPTGDCNDDGRIDICQIKAGEAADIDENGVIDECEDCNGNGIVDGFDIADGTSLDCQPDGVPDECQILVGDCNSDGIPDDCVPDCDGDGLPDDCEIASGEAEDIDGNGVPDECEDCNGNGIPDGLDVPPNGDEPDCDGDLVPDSCELGAADIIAVGNNDGTEEGSLTIGQPGWILWMEGLTVEAGGQYLDGVRLTIPSVPVGSDINLFLGVPVDGGDIGGGDGTPGELDILSIGDRLVTSVGEPIDIDLPDTFIGTVGTTYYIGAQFYDETPGWNRPISLDRTDVRGLAWLAYDLVDEIDPEDISGTAEVFTKLGELIADANYLLDALVFDGTRDNDADGDGIPDDCTGGGCTGDSNGDDRIDGADLTELLGAWGSDDPDFDLDGNGLVDGGDLTLLLGNWGQCR